MAGRSESAAAGRGDVAADAARVLDTLAVGELAILPLDVAYAIVGQSADAIRRLFAAKGRSYDKPSGMFGDTALSRELHLLPAPVHDMVEAVIEEDRLPFSIVAPFRADHPLVRAMDPTVLATSTKAGTLDMLLNAGPLHDAVAAESRRRGRLVVGSSANRSLTGSRYELGEIEPEVRAAAALALDYGRSRYANPEGRSSTIIDGASFRVLRVGVCFEALQAAFGRFGVTLLAPPAAAA